MSAHFCSKLYFLNKMNIYYFLICLCSIGNENGLYLNSKLNIICKSFCQFFINRVTRIKPAHFWRRSVNRFHPLIYTEVVCLGGSPNTSKTAGIEMGFLIPWVLCTEVFRRGLPCMVNIFFVTNPKSYKVCIRVWLLASTGEPVDVTTKPWSCHWCTSMMITHVNRLWASLIGFYLQWHRMSIPQCNHSLIPVLAYSHMSLKGVVNETY